MTTIQLRDEDGALYLGDSLLLRMYGAGDCDTCSWPMDDTSDHDRVCLAIALYDERECSDSATFPYGPVTILLPDGTEFDWEAALLVADAEEKARRAAENVC